MFINNVYAESDTITVQDIETTPEAPAASGMLGGSMEPLVVMILLFFVFYFLLIRPQEKKRRQQAELVAGVKKGEKILTNAGIFGVVTKIDDSENTVEIEISKGMNIKILKNSIADIVSRSKESNSALKTDKKVKKTNKKK